MKIAAIIPCFRVERHIVDVVERTLRYVDHVFVVDDRCPERSGDLVKRRVASERVTVLEHGENAGVGGATVSGYLAALAQGFDVLVKIDGDGQMNPEDIPDLVAPILRGEADYTKGNRFYRKDYLDRMPIGRLIGNSALSLITKASSGYWDIMDPTNGFTALHAAAAQEIEMHKLAKRYFFESDLLFRLNIARAVVKDVPLAAIYKDEKSNLKISRVLLEFPFLHLRNGAKRFVYNYVVRDFKPATLEVAFGVPLLLFGVIFGAVIWLQSSLSDRATPIGTVMLATLPIILGFQLLLAALSFDVTNVPSEPLQKLFKRRSASLPSMRLDRSEAV